MRRFLPLALIVPLLVVVFAGCGGGGGGTGLTLSSSPPIRTAEEASQRSTWTVLVYLNADNDLESAGIHNFNQMELAGSTADVHVIVQMDRKDAVDPNNERWTDTRRYLITRDSDPYVMHSVRLDSPPLGEQDMGDWHTLKQFVDWGVQNFPADHYCLVIWDHGTGWSFRSMAASALPLYKYISIDDTSYSELNIPEIAQALAGTSIDVLAFDACYMQELEIAYELRNSAKYLVASAATEPSPGYNYTRWLSRMGSGTSAQDLCRVIVEEYLREYPGSQSISQCAVDLGRIGDVASAADALAQVLSARAASDAAGLKSAREGALNYSVHANGPNRYNIDLLDYAQRCGQALGTDASAAYSTLRNAVGSAVVAEGHNSDLANTSGISVYIPPPSQYDSRYNQLQLAADTNWDEWLRAQTQ